MVCIKPVWACGSGSALNEVISIFLLRMGGILPTAFVPVISSTSVLL